MDLNREALVEYLEQKMGVDTADLKDDTPLFSSGIIDSFSMLDLIMFLETNGGFKIAPPEVTLDNLDSIQAILAFADEKRRSSE